MSNNILTPISAKLIEIFFDSVHFIYPYKDKNKMLFDIFIIKKKKKHNYQYFAFQIFFPLILKLFFFKQ